VSITPDFATLPGKAIGQIHGGEKVWVIRTQDGIYVKAWRSAYPDADKWTTIPADAQFELKESRINPGVMETFIKDKPKTYGGNRGGGGGAPKADPLKMAGQDWGNRLNNGTQIMEMAVNLAIASGQVGNTVNMPAIQRLAHEIARGVLDIAAQLKRSGDGA
jgi:hypothetical protein